MVRKLSEMRAETREDVRGGVGALAMLHLIEADESSDMIKMAAKFTILPGRSIGRHPHDSDGEMYIIVSGVGVMDDNGVRRTMHAGDAAWTANGEFHSIANESGEPLELYAIVIA